MNSLSACCQALLVLASRSVGLISYTISAGLFATKSHCCLLDVNTLWSHGSVTPSSHLHGSLQRLYSFVNDSRPNVPPARTPKRRHAALIF
ncbi:uncharacterized protein LAESUDRAFT_725860 [Laetiporus sulphureus 93-53]|uniref:Secreted protein n=1 Tax=Laetiporus sulphureus 93-53 TaxID=1314785 RepID=A0A165E827_9APHY|nr:uncharacterized protein LAESUDRAFT_725860 [Laetiporus sulphureus 93-53]KZT06424.1 hypothetical protein LAESUDRAFT_725860 [Laetiporus sulphureus 93-53]